MPEKLSVESLGGVPETLLIPLRAREIETRRKDALLTDEKACEILKALDIKSSQKDKISAGSQTGVVVRTLIVDEIIEAFLKEHPKAVVVSLGCGLDTRMPRLDNGRAHWVDIDFPQTIAIRQKFFNTSNRHTMIGASLTQNLWYADIPRDKPVLFYAEGVFMYLTEQDVKNIFSVISTRFPGAHIAFDAMSPASVKNYKRHPDVKKYNAPFQWGINDLKSLESWADGATLLGVTNLFDRHTDRFPFVLRYLRFLRFFREMAKVAYFKIDG